MDKESNIFNVPNGETFDPARLKKSILPPRTRPYNRTHMNFIEEDFDYDNLTESILDDYHNF